MQKKNNKTIVICSSVSFYSQVVEVQKQLKDLGFKVIVPLTVKKMVKSNDFRVETYKTWMERPEDYKRKAYLTKKHFAEVKKGDVALVLPPLFISSTSFNFSSLTSTSFGSTFFAFVVILLLMY